MNESTPGPWSIMDDGYSIQDTEGRLLGVVSFCIADGEAGIVEGKANARLMTAAPETAEQRDELLAALEALAHTFEGLSQQSEPPQDWDCDDYPAFVQAWAAIAKAKRE